MDSNTGSQTGARPRSGRQLRRKQRDGCECGKALGGPPLKSCIPHNKFKKHDFNSGWNRRSILGMPIYGVQVCSRDERTIR